MALAMPPAPPQSSPHADEQIETMESLRVALAAARAEAAEAQVRFRHAESTFGEAQRLSRTGSFSWWSEHGGMCWSPGTALILELPPSQAPSLDAALARVHPDNLDDARHHIAAAVSAKHDLDLETRLLMPGGEVKHMRVAARARHTAGSVEYHGVMIDITEQKLTLESLESALAETRRLKDQFHAAVDTIPGLVWTSQPDGNVDYLNQRWLEYTGLPLGEARGEGWQKAIHPEDLPGLTHYWRALLQTGQPGEYEARLRRHDGAFRWFLFRAVPSLDVHGTVIKWYGTNTDIEAVRASEHVARGQLETLKRTLTLLTQESEADKLLQHVLRLMAEQLDAHGVAVWDRSLEGDLTLLHTFETLAPDGSHGQAGPSSAVTLNTQGHPVWKEMMRTGVDCVLGDLASTPPRVRLAFQDDTTWLPWTGPGSEGLPAELRQSLAAASIVSSLTVPMLIGGVVGGAITLRFQGKRDLRSEEIELARALAHQAMLALQLTRLARDSREAAVMEERNRLARDIHDTLAQGFTGVIMQLQAARGAAERANLAAATQHIQRAEDLARQSLGEARRSVRALRPRSLLHGTLGMAMDEMLKQMTSGTGLKAEFHLEGEPHPLPPAWEDTLLRVVQESLTNTLKHSGARAFHATLAFVTNGVRLRLTDDGCGFDAHDRRQGLGLLGMQERIDRIRGRCSVVSRPAAGTAITVELDSDGAPA